MAVPEDKEMQQRLTRSFSEMLTEELELQEMQQTELAKAIGHDATNVNHWIKGRKLPTIATICRIADVLGVTVDYLLGRESV